MLNLGKSSMEEVQKQRLAWVANVAKGGHLQAVSSDGYWAEQSIPRTTDVPAHEGQAKQGSKLGFVMGFVGVLHG